MICLSITSLDSVLTTYGLKRDIKPGSLAQLRVTVDSVTRWHGSPLPLLVLTEDLACEFLLSLRAAGLAPRTVNGRRGDLITLWRFAFKQGFIGRAPDPTEIIRFREPERNPIASTQDELARHLAACMAYRPSRPIPGWDGRHWKCLSLVIYSTAFRASATLLLEKAQIRPSGAVIALAETQKTFCDEVGWLTPETMDAVRELPPSNSPLLLPFPYSKPKFYFHWKRMLQSAGLPATRRDGPQKMRRTSATWVEKASPGSAMRHLGHKTPGLAQKHYIDRTIAAPAQASRLLPRIGGGQRTLFE